MGFYQFQREIQLCAFVFHFNIFDDWKPQLDRGDPVLDDEFQRLKTEVHPKRVVRDLEEVSNFLYLESNYQQLFICLFFKHVNNFIEILLPRDF